MDMVIFYIKKAQLPYTSVQNVIFWTILEKIEENRKFDRSGIRTHASEDTAALTQRLRPLGHPAFLILPGYITMRGY